MEIVEAIADIGANLIENVEQFNSSILNKTFEVPWNNTVVYGDPGSLLVYPLSPECPPGQALDENGYICGKHNVNFNPFLIGSELQQGAKLEKVLLIPRSRHYSPVFDSNI